MSVPFPYSKSHANQSHAAGTPNAQPRAPPQEKLPERAQETVEKTLLSIVITLGMGAETRTGSVATATLYSLPPLMRHSRVEWKT